MNKKIFTISRQKKSYFSFIAFIGIPTIIICLALVAIMFVNFSASKNVLQNTTVSALSRIARASEAKTASIVDATQLLGGNQILRQCLEETEAGFDQSVCFELSTLKNTYSFLDSVYILNQNQGMICNTEGIYPIDNFFEEVYQYQNYNRLYWENFRFYNTTDYRVLSPTIVTTQTESKEVMPIIFRRAKNLTMKNMIVFNINLEHLIDYAETDTLNMAFPVYLLNKYTSEVFSSDGKVLPANSFPEEVYSRLLLGTQNTFEYKFPQGRTIITTYSSGNTLNGYSYFALIPTKDITRQLLPNIGISLAIILLFLLVSCTALFRNASHIFNPLWEVSRMLSTKNEKDESGNFLQNLAAHASDMQQMNESLAAALPCAQEKYLIDYLNATEYYIDENTRDIIKESLQFPNEYFAVVIVQMAPTGQLFDLYNTFEYANIQNGFYNIIKDLFAGEFQSFVLPGDKNTLYIILNLRSQEQIQGIEQILKTIYELLKNDMEYVNLSIGKSSAYEGLEGLKQAHLEATDSLTLYDSGHILLENPQQFNFDFSRKAESELFSALLSANTQKTYEILNQTLESNRDIPPRTQKQLYNHLLNIVLKAMRLKKVPYKENKLDFEILNDLLSQPSDGIRRDMMTLVDYLLASGNAQRPDTAADSASIVKYIEENFTFPGLSLDFLTEYFHVSQSNLSMMIKNTLGIGFHEYLSMLRVEKAKTLLTSTDKNVIKICQECGFSSEQTFYRTFKKLAGQTPTEFRNNKTER